MEVQRTDVTTDRVLTVPNALSAARLAAVPMFLWLLLGPHLDGWAVLLLAAAAFTDWLDGKVARAFGQISRVGQLLDPLADRLYILSTLLALGVREIVPWWLVAILIGRDIVLLATAPVLRSRGVTALPVHFLGKAATFNLLYALPLLLLGSGGGIDPSAGTLTARVFGWAFVIWGASLYWYSAGLYLRQTAQVLHELPRSGRMSWR